MSEEVRINKYLAQCELGSRRECDKLIAAGRISLNGTRIKEMGIKMVPNKDIVSFKGVDLYPPAKKRYIAYHKPRDTIVTRIDPQGRKTIYDALANFLSNSSTLRYIGRLDRNSEGLLLLTDDGELIYALTHPKFHIKKVYLVRSSSLLAQKDMETMTEVGVMSEGYRLFAGSIRPVATSNKDEFWYEVILYEGKNRQVRRLFNELGYDVLRLKRTQFGAIKLRDLRLGSCRKLGEREIKALKSKGYKV